MNKQKTLELSLLCGLIFTLLLSMTGFDAGCAEIRQKVFRLHILANSDSAEDQALKIKVRDEILSLSDGIFSASADKEEAISAAREHLDDFLAAAKSVITKNGCDYTVKGEITPCYFDTRVYENFTLPAGYYDALRIIIGKGAGHNWWCVLFPKVCISASADFHETLSESSEKIVSDPKEYKVRFKIVELCENAREKINSWFS